MGLLFGARTIRLPVDQEKKNNVGRRETKERHVLTVNLEQENGEENDNEEKMYQIEWVC